MAEFRKMRRFRQQLPDEMALAILKAGSSCVLALAGDDGYPYAVPVSYVCQDGKIYFHGAKSGHKVDAISRCDKASLCVVAKDDIVENEFTTYFRSVIVFGRIRALDNDDDKRTYAAALARKYSPHESEMAVQKAIDKEWDALAVYEMTIEHMTGKEAKELVREREAR